MDLDKLKSIVSEELSAANELYSLKLQNHLYGCFLVMEDIVQKVIDVSGNTLTGSKFSIDLDQQFGEIGLRYGFILDTKLLLESSSHYKDVWIAFFQTLQGVNSIEEVDKIEDNLIEVVQNVVKAEQAYFIYALETGSLPQEWIAKVLELLTQTTTTLTKSDSDDDIKMGVETALTTAKTEKPLKTEKRRHMGLKKLAFTRRNRINGLVNLANPVKKSLSKTRRNISQKT
jgi:hypothetical protein